MSPTDPHVPQSLACAEPFGRLLAIFHAAVDGFETPPGSEWTQLTPAMLMGGDTTWIERLYAHAADDAADLIAWWHDADDVLRSAVASDIGMCHGEAHPKTCRFVGDDLAVAELDWAGVGDRAYDVATLRWVLELHVPDQAAQLFATFLASYARVRDLPDLSALRAWVAARHLWSMRLAAGFAGPVELHRRASFVAAWPIALTP